MLSRTIDTVQRKRGRRVAAVATLWSMGVLSAFAPIPYGGNLIALGLSVLWWGAIIAATVWLSRGTPRPIGSLTVLGSAGLCALLMNWSVVAPQAWFRLHRPFFEAAVHAQADAGRDQWLPLPLLWLSVDGRTSWICATCDGPGTHGGQALFFPQWFGFPDDAGGYIYAPGRAPDGMDMSGKLCVDATDLGGGWWMCGMSSAS